MPWDPPRGARGNVRDGGSLGIPAQTAAPVTAKKMDGWMDVTECMTRK